MFESPFFTLDRTASRCRFARCLSVLVTTALTCMAVIISQPAPAQVPVPSHRTYASDMLFKSSLNPPLEKGVPAFIPGAAEPGRLGQRIDRQDILDLEPAVAQAELILAVRLVDVTETKIVRGGRNVEITEQFRFEPVRVLKGIFARESLLMTGQDLGIYRFAESSDRLTRGQLLLVLLGRQGQNYFNCNGGQTLAQSIPRLENQDDPLLPAVDVLIAMTRKRDRADRIILLREGLKTAAGQGVAPLLQALGRRALLAAHAEGAIKAILPHLRAASPAVREVAARTIELIMDADAQAQSNSRPEITKAILASLETTGPEVASRVALIDALGSVGEPARRVPTALTWLKATREVPTLAETAARLRALAKLGAVEQKDDIARIFKTLALDAPTDFQYAAGQALGRLDPPAAAALISSRLASKHAAGLGVAIEIDLLGRLPQRIAAPELLQAWNRQLGPQESLAFASACARIADPRFIPAVSTLLDPRQWQVRAYAVEALRKIDTDEAASALWPHLDEESDLSRKLKLIAFLGRHGFREGYAQALEHLSQVNLREEAVEAIAAIGEPKAIPELRRIWQTSNDLAWNAAAIRALARLGQADITPKLLEMARMPGEPLAASALIGLGDLGSSEAIPIVRDALSSRSDELVIAAARAAAKLLARPAISSDQVRDRLASLLADADASPAVRQAALDALTALHDTRLTKALEAAARDANLEGSPLLEQVEHLLATRTVTPKLNTNSQ